MNGNLRHEILRSLNSKTFGGLRDFCIVSGQKQFYTFLQMCM